MTSRFLLLWCNRLINFLLPSLQHWDFQTNRLQCGWFTVRCNVVELIILFTYGQTLGRFCALRLLHDTSSNVSKCMSDWKKSFIVFTSFCSFFFKDLCPLNVCSFVDTIKDVVESSQDKCFTSLTSRPTQNIQQNLDGAYSRIFKTCTLKKSQSFFFSDHERQSRHKPNPIQKW